MDSPNQDFEITSNENSNTSYIRCVLHHPLLKWPYIKTYKESETGVKEWQVCAIVHLPLKLMHREKTVITAVKTRLMRSFYLTTGIGSRPVGISAEVRALIGWGEGSKHYN